MSKRTLISNIRRELAAINDRIDTAIVRGISYRSEARRHRELLALLRRAQEEQRLPVSWKALLGGGRVSPARRSLVGGASRRVLVGV